MPDSVHGNPGCSYWFAHIIHHFRFCHNLQAAIIFRAIKKPPAWNRGLQLVKKGFDKLVDEEASSPATATLTSLR